jgi:hypothetical protein
MLEKEYGQKGIEYKFSTTLLDIAVKHYQKEYFENIIEKKYDNIEFVNEKIITSLNNIK